LSITCQNLSAQRGLVSDQSKHQLALRLQQPITQQWKL
jgi:hypothetical protein